MTADLSLADLSMPDMSTLDLSLADLIPPPDLTEPPIVWTQEQSGLDLHWKSIWGSANGANVYVAGDRISPQSGQAIIYSTGNGMWTTQSTLLITSLWGSGPTDVYATRPAALFVEPPRITLLRNPGNGTWPDVTATNFQENLWSVAGSSASNVYAGGQEGKILHWNGNNWALENCGGMTAGHSIESIFVTNAKVYASGTGDNLCVSNGNGSWTLESTNTGATRMLAVWGTSAGDLYAAGMGTGNPPPYYLAQSNGAGTWQPATLPPGVELAVGSPNAFWGTDPANVYLVARFGRLLHTTGNRSWTVEQIRKSDGTLVADDLLAIWGSARRNIYVVGNNGLILRGK
jgi:hypothetical protein